MSGFRYFLVLKDGEPADPAMFATAVPGDLQKFRILAIDPKMSGELSRDFQTTWTVEPT